MFALPGTAQEFDCLVEPSFGVPLDLPNTEAAISGGQRYPVSFDSPVERAR